MSVAAAAFLAAAVLHGLSGRLAAQTLSTQPQGKKLPKRISAQPVPVMDAEGLKRLVKGYKGRVVMLDFWATWCAPCVKGLPKLDPLQKKFGEKDLRIIPVSFDDPAKWTRQAEPVLAKAGWKGPAVVIKDRDEQIKITDWLARRWRSELPAQFIFDREGNVVYEVLEVNVDDLPPMEKMIDNVITGKATTQPAASKPATKK